MSGDDPAVAADSFPRPPHSFSDAEERTIEVRAHDADPEPLVAMYEGFDPADRAQGVPPTQPDRIRSWLDVLLSEGLNVLAWHERTVVGHAVLVPDDDAAWELAIFVTQAYQEAGIGTEVLRTLLGHGAEHGVEVVWLTVERWNRPAIALYESVGFAPVDAERFEMGMSLRLVDDPDAAGEE